MNGIDVSVYQGKIDWEKVKQNIDFAILRCGFGSNGKDKQFDRNYSECTRLGIPFAVYFFSYGITDDAIQNEVGNIKQILNGKKISAPIYIDIENTKKLNWRTITNAELLRLMKLYKTLLEDAGYKMGIYSSRTAFWNEKMTDAWYDTISKWVAEYPKLKKFTRKYDIWQSSCNGSVAGISTVVDLDTMVNSIFDTEKKTAEEIAQEVLDGKWGNGAERKKKLIAAGYDYTAVQNAVNKILATKTVAAKKTTTEIAKEVLAGKWGNGAERKKKLTDAGYNYTAVQAEVTRLIKK